MISRISTFLFIAVLAISPLGTVKADSVSYILDNVVMTNGDVITGKFTWTYPTGDFGNGSGVFTEIVIPGYGSDITGLNVTIDLTSIEVTLKANLDNKNLDIILRLLTALNPNQPSVMDISQNALGVYASKYDLTGYVSYWGAVGGFVSGTITPLPAQLGDLNNNGTVDAADYLQAMKIVLENKPPTAVESYALDVAPLNNGVPNPDGQLNAGDLLVLGEKILGIVNF